DLDPYHCLEVAQNAQKEGTLSREQLFPLYQFAASEFVKNSGSLDFEKIFLAYQGAISTAPADRIGSIVDGIIPFVKALQSNRKDDLVKKCYQIIEDCANGAGLTDQQRILVHV